LVKSSADAGVSGKIRQFAKRPPDKDVGIAGSLEAWTGMWEAEPTGRVGAAAIDPAHRYRLANLPQGE
jgi:hypothetical protein